MDQIAVTSFPSSIHESYSSQIGQQFTNLFGHFQHSTTLVLFVNRRSNTLGTLAPARLSIQQSSCQIHPLDNSFTFHDFVNMSTSTVSARLDDKEIAELDALTQLAGFDRSAVLKSIFRKGIQDWRMELAVQKYRAEEVTLSRAAEIAGISQWDFMARMDEAGLELHYGPEDLEDDLQAIQM